MDLLSGDHGASSEEQAWMRVVEVSFLSVLPMALKAAIKLHVMDILAQHSGGPDDEQQYLSAFQIASHFEEHSIVLSTSLLQASTSLDRILRVLASHGILSSSLSSCSNSPQPTRTYGLTSVSQYLLQGRDGNSLAPFVLLNQDPVCLQALSGLHESVIDGSVPFRKAHDGMDFFSYAATDAKFAQLCNAAMAGQSELFMQALLQKYHGFETIDTLVDVGGGVGATLSMIISKYPHIKGINFDLPRVIIAPASKNPDIEFVGGDMFSSIPKGETILLKAVLHNWSDEDCVQILKNCYKALPRKGKIIVVDYMLPIEVAHEPYVHSRYHLDLLMYSCFEGKERTKEDFESISKAAGFYRVESICIVGGYSILEFLKEDM